MGVLLVNLGSTDRADAPAVRRYLREFLADRRVIEKQGLAWKAVLNLVILPRRPAVKARDYRKIWNRERDESPLFTITRAQAEKVAALLAPHDHVVVDWAMRYGNPPIRSRVASLAERGCTRLLVVPLYPQYAATTVATVCDEVFRALLDMRAQPTLRVAPPYHEETAYIDALATSMQRSLAALPFTPEVILASFHGMPQAYIDQGDPYQMHCEATTRLLRQRLGLDERQLLLTYQSRFGRDQWLLPATDETVKRLAREGVRRMAVVTPGFAADCLETLEEIVQENAGYFHGNGGEHFALLPCLNDSEESIDLLHSLVLRELSGWLEVDDLALRVAEGVGEL